MNDTWRELRFKPANDSRLLASASHRSTDLDLDLSISWFSFLGFKFLLCKLRNSLLAALTPAADYN